MDYTSARQGETSQDSSSSSSSGCKLRSACNNCHAAKVRCSGEKTGCRRCEGMNEPCVYSISRVGKVVGNRGKYNQARKREQERLQRERELQNQQQQQQPREREHSRQVLSPPPPQERNSLNYQRDEQHDNRQRQWSEPEQSHSPQRQVSVPPNHLQGRQSISQQQTVVNHSTYANVSQWHTNDILGPDPSITPTDSSSNPTSSNEAASADWIEVSVPMDNFESFGNELNDLLAPSIQFSAEQTLHSSTANREPLSPHLSLDDPLFNPYELDGDDNMDFIFTPPPSHIHSASGPEPPRNNTSRPDFGSPSITNNGKRLHDLSSTSGLITPDGGEHSQPQSRTPSVSSRYVREPARSNSASSTNSYSNNKELRTKCIFQSASILTSLETYLETLYQSPGGHTSNNGSGSNSGSNSPRFSYPALETSTSVPAPPTLDSIMETNRRTTRAVRRVLEGTGAASSPSCVRILIMAMELAARILAAACALPPPNSSANNGQGQTGRNSRNSSSLYDNGGRGSGGGAGSGMLGSTFGAYVIGASDQEWLRRRLLGTEVQRTLDLVKALRATYAASAAAAAAGGGAGGSSASAAAAAAAASYDTRLLALVRSLQHMLVEVRSEEDR